jgi:predicted metalloprotease with PDZ domain
MKKKNKLIIATLAVSAALLILILAGCSFNIGPLSVNISKKLTVNQQNFTKKQPGTNGKQLNPGNKNFGCVPGFKNFKNIDEIPFLGIEMSQTSGTVKGVLIENVIDGSAAEKAGIKAQDIITVFNGNAVAKPVDIYNLVLANKVGDSIKVTVSRNDQNIELTVTLGSIKDVMPNIVTNEKDFPYIGIEISQTTGDIKGILINNVITQSPAEKAGLKTQDIITAYNGEAVNNPFELYNKVLGSKIGDIVKITINRNGQSQEISLTLESAQDNHKNPNQNQNQNQNQQQQEQGNPDDFNFEGKQA